MEGIKRSALKASATKGKKKYKTIKTLKYVGVFVAVAAITALSVYALNQNATEESVGIEPTTELGIEALPTQGFELNTAQDTVIETENGSVYVIPAEAFETESGEAVTGKVTFEIKEAFEDVDIMKAGLTTTSNGELLETGGMFFLDATQNGQKLRLKKGKEILSQLPNLYPEKDMKLFDGEKQADGTINWVNPKEFEKDLITVDITSLDFYPEGYVEELSKTRVVRKRVPVSEPSQNRASRNSIKKNIVTAGFGFSGAQQNNYLAQDDGYPDSASTIEELYVEKFYSKEFTDSLYYSFARLFERNEVQTVSDSSIVAEKPIATSHQIIDAHKSSSLIEPVKWRFSYHKINKTDYEVIAEATLDEGWKIFSTKNKSETVKASEMKFVESSDYKVVGATKEDGLNGRESGIVFDENLAFFTDKVRFSQRIRSNKNFFIIKGDMFSMAFNDKMSLPPDMDPFYLVVNNSEEQVESSLCPIPSGINPAKVKAIWNKKFNKTILATREFEERMRVIHESHQDRILEVYVNNLDKPLWYSDSIAMITFSSTAEKFRAFYEQRKGGVKVNDNLANKLTNYFTKKHKEFTTKSSQSYKDYQQKKRELRKEFENKKSKKDREEYNRKAKVFDEEYKINLCNAATQIGKKGYCGEPIPPGNITVRINTIGAKNIDQYVFEATRDRKSMVYTDPNTGKVATLTYKPLKATITNSEQFDKVFIYLLPDSISSFNRMKTTDNINFDFSLNMLFSYKLIAMGYKGKQAYFAEVKNVSPQNYSVSLTSISENELKRKLKRNKSQAKQEILADKDFYEAEMVNTSRKKKYKSDGELTLRIGKFLFPEVSENCLEGGSATIIYDNFSNSGLFE